MTDGVMSTVVSGGVIPIEEAVKLASISATRLDGLYDGYTGELLRQLRTLVLYLDERCTALEAQAARVAELEKSNTFLRQQLTAEERERDVIVKALKTERDALQQRIERAKAAMIDRTLAMVPHGCPPCECSVCTAFRILRGEPAS